MSEPSKLSYPIPLCTRRVQIEESRSKFIATAGKASSVEEARAFIARTRAEMPDATHHVYGFRVGYGHTTTEGMSDDGEPAGTAGPPVLAVLRGSALGDVILVVTRYFGGTKLGTGGLVRAYTSAAQLALSGLQTELKISRITLGIDTEYHYYSAIKRLLSDHGAIVDTETLTDRVSFLIMLPETELEAFTRRVRELTAGTSEIIYF